MKKIFLLLLVSAFAFACSDDNDDPKDEPGIPLSEWEGDWNDPESPHYSPDRMYDPIKGEWIVRTKNGKSYDDFLAYRFRNCTWVTATVKPSQGKDPNYKGVKDYGINDKQLGIMEGSEIVKIYRYSVTGELDDETLTLSDGIDTYTLKPYTEGAWRWKGDWNDPADPHYAVYGGNYNPVKGTWKLILEDGKPSRENLHHRYREDFIVEESYRYPDGNFHSQSKYRINNTGIKITSPDDGYVYTFKYELNAENTILKRTVIYYDYTQGAELTFERIK